MDRLKVDEINLERYFFPVVEITANAEHSPGEETMTFFAVNTNVVEIEESNRLAVDIDVRSSQEESTNPPYNFKVSGIAFFNIVIDEYDPENAKDACYVMGHQVLFGAIREQIAAITGRGPWNAIQLRVVPAPVRNPVEETSQEESKEATNLDQ